jgi:phi13 family phage major tail protein
MAKKGIRYAVFATATIAANGTITYANGKYISPVVGFNGAMNKASGKDYGDDRIVDTENSVTGGTLTVELNNDEDDIYTYLLGHTKATGGASNTITYNIDDVAPKVGVGALGKSGDKWVAKWYALVQFSEPNDDNSTKTESVTFQHVTLEGEILIPEDGNWKEREVFDTEAAAKNWLNGKAGITD